jgi:hypothetical protein
MQWPNSCWPLVIPLIGADTEGEIPTIQLSNSIGSSETVRFAF